jgi:cyclophilin family peptidyl-prolyl cis-trans isomerase
MNTRYLIALSALTLAGGCTSTGNSVSAVGEAVKPSQEAPVEAAKPEYPSPPEIVAKAEASEWVAIAASDLLVMDLSPDAKGKARRVVIQLVPAPFSQGWVSNIRKLSAARFWDGTSVNRVQDNYVVQWGDATEKKVLPEGLVEVPESEYHTSIANPAFATSPVKITYRSPFTRDAYSRSNLFYYGWPIAYHETLTTPIENATTGESIPVNQTQDAWPVHCYGMVGVGRNLSPNTGSGAELYTVIGHAPRHLDRNIALVGRVIEGIEHLSSLPRGTGPLGFYEKEEERVPILSVRIGNEIADLPAFEYLSTESASFAKYADARANRRDPFFNVPAGGADICNIPVPVRRKVQ